MRNLYTFFVFLYSFTSLAQEDKVLIPTPESSSLIKWSQNEVNLSTGALNTTIPLYSLKDGGLNVPIALHYNGSSGIKVDESATCVGLGWDLVAGGKIVRVIRDKPDEGYSLNPVRNERGGIDYIKLGGTFDLDSLLTISTQVGWQNEGIVYRGFWFINGNPLSSNDFKKSDPAFFDTQPDIYMAYIGDDVVKFTFDNNKNPIITNNKDYKIDVVWENYDPSSFYTKQTWSYQTSLSVGESIKRKIRSVTGINANLIPTTLGVTYGLNQFFRKKFDNQQKILGFKSFIITNTQGVEYHFGGSPEFLEYNFNYQGYLVSDDRLSIAVNNMYQRIPSSWSLQKIVEPNGNKNNRNKIEFKYKRTGYYEPFISSEDLVNPINECSVPQSVQERFVTKAFNFEETFINTVGAAFVNTVTSGVVGLQYNAPNKADLDAYVTLNTNVIYGLLPDSIISSNYIVTFNSINLQRKTPDSTQIRNLIPNFKNEDFFDLTRLDSQMEDVLSSEEENRKGLIKLDKNTGEITVTYKNLTATSGSLASLDISKIKNLIKDYRNSDYSSVESFLKNFYPSVKYQGDYGSFNADGSGVFLNLSGSVFEVDLSGEFRKVLNPNEKIRNIEIKDKETGLSKGYYFDYGYFDGVYPLGYTKQDFVKENMQNLFENMQNMSLVSDLPEGFYRQLHEKYGIYQQEDRFRLKLKGIYEMKIADSNTGLQPGFIFEYNSNPLPRRLSMSQDYWGYYNGEHENRNKTQLISTMKLGEYDLFNNSLGTDGDPACPNSSDLRSDFNFANSGILTGIKFPTGASKLFRYELHDAEKFYGKIGGLRIKEVITTEPQNSKSYIEKYKYLTETGKSSGNLSLIPEYLFKHYTGGQDKVVLSNYAKTVTSSFLNDSYMRYSRVIKYDSTLNKINGKTVYEFNSTEGPAKRLDNKYENAILATTTYDPINILLKISFDNGIIPPLANILFDFDLSLPGNQSSFYSNNQGTYSLNLTNGLVNFQQNSNFSGFPSELVFSYKEASNDKLYTGRLQTIPYNYGQGPKVIGSTVTSNIKRLGFLPVYDYSKNSINSIKIYNNNNILVNKTEYFYSPIGNYGNSQTEITGAQVISAYPVYKTVIGGGISLNFKKGSLPSILQVNITDVVAKSGIVYNFRIPIERFDLIKEVNTIWDLNGQNPVSTEKRYKYSYAHHNPIETSMTNSKGQELKNKITYSFDLNTGNSTDTVNFNSLPDLANKVDPRIYTDLRYKYMNLPIEEISIIDTMVIGGKFLDIYADTTSTNIVRVGLPKTEFVLELDAPLAESQFNKMKMVTYYRQVNNSQANGFENQYFPRFIKDTRYVPRIFIEEYNAKGLPSKYRKSGDVSTKVTYGFNDLIPISKTAAFGTPLARTTNYEYIPLYGLTRVTNPNLTSQKYDYDELGRLKAVRNEQNEILKSYVYKILGF